MTATPLCAAALVAALSAFMPAQDPSAVVRADDALVIRVDGPERIRACFLATNVGSVLAGHESMDFWAALRGPFEGLLGGLGGGEGSKVAALLAQLDGYRGRVTVGVSLLPSIGGVIVLAPDERTDLTAFAGTIEEGLRNSPLHEGATTVGAREVPCFFASQTGGLTAPIVTAGHLMVFFGEDLLGELGRRFGATAEGAFETDASTRRAPFALRVRMAALLEAAEGSSKLWGFDGVEVVESLEVLGLSAIDEVRVLVAPEGPYVAFEQSIRFHPGVERGVFDGLLPDSREPPAMIGLVPPDARFWQAGKLRPGVAVLAVVKAVARLLGTDEVGLDEAFAQWREFVRDGLGGVDVQDDLFAYAEDDVLLFGDLFGRDSGGRREDTPDEPRPLGAAGPTGLMVVKLADAEAFAESLERAIADGYLFSYSRRDWATQVEEHSGVTIHHAPGDRDAWAVTDEFAAMASGPDAVEWVRALLVRWHSMRDVAAPDELPTALRKARRRAPEGYSGCGAFDVRGLLGVPLWEMFDLDDAVGEWTGDGWAEAFAQLRPTLEQHSIERAVGFSGWQGDRWSYRILW